MAAAADRDSVAAEYATGYAVTFDLGLPALARALDAGLGPRAATVELFLAPARGGPGHADRAQARSRRGRARLGRRGPGRSRGRAALEAFDASLRLDGNALNPGTTADLVTAVLFVALLEGLL